MFIIISNSKDIPIYEQIVEQIKEKIINNELLDGEALPSIRALAHDLQISVITTKRAYEELERQGYISTIAGKGSFISAQNKQLLKEEILKKIELNLQNALFLAQKNNITYTEILDMLTYLYEEENNGK